MGNIYIYMDIDNLCIIYGSGCFFSFFSPTPLQNMSSSVGMMNFPIYYVWKNENHVPVTNQERNHPEYVVGIRLIAR